MSKVKVIVNGGAEVVINNATSVTVDGVVVNGAATATATAAAAPATPVNAAQLRVGDVLRANGDIVTGEVTVKSVHLTNGGKAGRAYPQVVVNHPSRPLKAYRFAGDADIAKLSFVRAGR